MCILTYILLLHVCESFTPEIVRRIDLELIRTCGGECVNTFHDVFPDLSNSQDVQKTVDTLTRAFQQDLEFVKESARDLQTVVATSFGSGHMRTIREHKRPDKPQARVQPNTEATSEKQGPPGTACSSATKCQELGKKINQCNDVRILALQIYESVNKMVHAFQAVLRLSCACLFEGPVTVCALAGFPYTCSIFFNGFRGLFSSSRSLYTLSGALVTTCGMLSGLILAQ